VGRSFRFLSLLSPVEFVHLSFSFVADVAIVFFFFGLVVGVVVVVIVFFSMGRLFPTLRGFTVPVPNRSTSCAFMPDTMSPRPRSSSRNSDTVMDSYSPSDSTTEYRALLLL
jgi:hypothetical protein